MEVSPALTQFAMFIPIIAAFYFLLIRPQQKRQKEMQAMLNALQKNDRVLTSGGLIGRVIKINGDELLVEIGENVEVNMMRHAIVQKLPQSATSAPKAAPKADKPKVSKPQRKSPAKKTETQ